MNALRVFSYNKCILNQVNNVLKQNSVRTLIIKPQDWIPGPRPTNEEERIKAAKKYNMLPEEYEPQPDDGLACGDYPNVKAVHADNKDPYYPFDYPAFRSNYGEVMPDDFIIKTHDKSNLDTFHNRRVPIWKQFQSLALFCVVFLGLVYIFGVKYPYYNPHYGIPQYDKNKIRYEYPD